MTNTHFTMPKVQVLVASAGQARFFTLDSPTADLIELSSAINPEARMREEDLMDDRRGRYHDQGGAGRSAIDESTDPKDVTIQRFARELAHKLERERTQRRLERLYLVASPSFLGELRKHLSNHLKPLLAGEIAKDFTHLDSRELRKHLPERLK